MNKKRFLIILTILFVTFNIFAFGNREKYDAKVGILVRNTEERFIKDYIKELEKLAKEDNIFLEIKDSENNEMIQVDQLNDLIEREYLYFIIIANNTESTEQMAQIMNIVGGKAVFVDTMPSVEALKIGIDFYLVTVPPNEEKSTNLIKDSESQAMLSYNIMLNVINNGSSNGLEINGFSPLKEVLKVEPLNDKNIINQCYLVPSYCLM